MSIELCIIEKVYLYNIFIICLSSGRLGQFQVLFRPGADLGVVEALARSYGSRIQVTGKLEKWKNICRSAQEALRQLYVAA
jgi:hypothetical protein